MTALLFQVALGHGRVLRIDPFDALAWVCFFLALATPFIAKWTTDNKWRWGGGMQDKHCGICGRSWWFHHRDGYTLTCMRRKK